MASSSTSRERRTESPDTTGDISLTSAEQIGYSGDILREIFRNLPVKPLFRFKKASKLWYEIISNTDWSILWKPKPISGLYMCIAREENPNSACRFIPLDSEVEYRDSCKPGEKSLAFINAPARILQSCNGLLLCCSPDLGETEQANTIYYVCNPVMKQFTKLPRPHRNPEDGSVCGIHLAVNFSNSLEYKVLALSYCSGVAVSRTVQIEIYSSKTRTWKFSSYTFEAENYRERYNTGVYWKSAIHWPSIKSETAPFFNVDTECLGVTPMPPVQCGYGSRAYMYFGESNGHLLLADYSDFRRVPYFFVFEMKDDYSEWFAKYLINLYNIDVGLAQYHPYLAGRLLRENMFRRSCIGLLSIVCRDKDHESFMVFRIEGTVMAYNLIRGTCEKICDLQLRSEEEAELLMYGYKVVHHYIETPFWV